MECLTCSSKCCYLCMMLGSTTTTTTTIRTTTRARMTRRDKRRKYRRCHANGRKGTVLSTVVTLTVMMSLVAKPSRAWITLHLGYSQLRSMQTVRPFHDAGALSAIPVHHDDNDTDDETMSSSTLPWNRRTLIQQSLVLVGTTLLASPSPSMAKHTTPRDESIELSQLAVGNGYWQSLTEWNQRQPNTVEASTDSYIALSPEFLSYGTRVLINFDPNVAAWWETQTSRKETDQNSLFVDLATTFGRTWQSILAGPNQTQKFYEQFVQTWGNENSEEALRQVNLWFAMLPDAIQPTKWKIQSTVPRGSDFQMEQSSLDLMNTFNSDLTALLPSLYRVERSIEGNAKIVPPLPKIDSFPFGQLAPSSSSGASSLLTRSRPFYGLKVYALLGLAGATGCAITHATVIPLDVVKTRAQTETSGQSLVQQAKELVQRQGWSSLFLGAQATIAGYFWYGASVYPAYTFSKRWLTTTIMAATTETTRAMVNPMVLLDNPDIIALLAGALAAVVASLGLTPLEAARIRAVANPETYAAPGVVGTLQVLAEEKALYAGFPSLLTRQVIFGSVKFLAFERFAEFLVATWPDLLGLPESSWIVSLVAGGMSGAVSALVSQPADSLLTYVAAAQKQQLQDDACAPPTSLLRGLKQLWVEEGPGALWRGLGSRSVWAGSIIAGQFFLYDIFRTAAGVSKADLTQVWTYEVHL